MPLLPLKLRSCRPARWLGLLVLAGCGGSPAPTPAVPGTEQPANFPAMVYAPAQNPPDAATFELGRQLFYDPRLSRTGQVSCASCHQQAAAFADAGQPLSRGVEGRLGTRNSPALQNLRWKTSFLTDGGVSHLENQPLAPLGNAQEMDQPLTELLTRLNADAEYKRQFAAIYGEGPIDSYRLLRALAQFTAALTASHSRYDQFVRGEDGVRLSAGELRGRALFSQRCASCHASDLFTDESFRNNGLDGSFARDSGRAHITGLAADRGKFKVPSLRNVALTAPYMHDGRFQTLEQVLAHYAHGVVDSPTLDPALRQPGGQLGIPLSAAEQQDLQAFLLTLTDQQLTTDPRLGPPR